MTAKTATSWWIAPGSVTVLLVLVLPCTGSGQGPRGSLPKPILARVEGYIGEPPAVPQPLASWTLSNREKLHRFQVLHITVLRGDVSPFNIVDAMEPYADEEGQVTFFMRGPEAVLDKLAALAPNQRVVLIGYLRFGQRQFNLSDVEMTGEPAP